MLTKFPLPFSIKPTRKFNLDAMIFRGNWIEQDHLNHIEMQMF